MTQANTEHGQACIQDFPYRLDGIGAWLGVARSVGEKHAIRIHSQHLGRRRLRRYHRDPAAAVGKHAQDISLDAEVVGHHVVLSVGLCRFALIEAPRSFRPLIDIPGSDHAGQILALHARKSPGSFQCGMLITFSARHQAAALGALVPENSGQRARIYIADRDDPVTRKVFRQTLFTAPVAQQHRKITDDQPGGHGCAGFFISGGAAGIADMRECEGHQLPGIRRVGENFLVTGHRGVEHHFTAGLTFCADAAAMKDGSVFQRQNRFLRQSPASRYAKRESRIGLSRLDQVMLR